MKQQLATFLLITLMAGTAFAKTDSDLSAMARKSLEQDSTLSPEAKNVHIKVEDGRASLRGSVNSPQEKADIRAKVMAVDGIKSVDDKVQIRE